jgi:hypothetical protein
MFCCLWRRDPRALHNRGALPHARGPIWRGAAALLLLFIGIHNAWDGVSYHVFVSRRDTLRWFWLS